MQPGASFKRAASPANRAHVNMQSLKLRLTKWDQIDNKRQSSVLYHWIY